MGFSFFRPLFDLSLLLSEVCLLSVLFFLSSFFFFLLFVFVVHTLFNFSDFYLCKIWQRYGRKI
ncbi:hypothetical protein EC81_008120 [Bacteroides fragilis]|nr:hypothetical protein EE52_007450 [Bacteroides fragilis]QCQ53771.1 hypothetical protein EC81_008120 [Bacteroides fragilis]